MHRLIKQILALIIRCSGIPFLIREVLCRNRVTIAMYHNPNPEVFARHLKFLSRHYNFLPLERLVNAIHSGDWSHIPPKSLVITLDDGHLGNYELLPLFRVYNIVPTIYLCTQIINTNRHFWFRADGIWGGHLKKYRESLKKLPNQQRLARLKKECDFEPQKPFAERQTLNRDELVEMAPDVDFQVHSQFHPILTTCTDAECEQEIRGSKGDLEQLLKVRPDHFCYPNGDYTERELCIAKQAGYKSARTSDCGWNNRTTHPYRLKAMDISDDAGVNQLVAQMSGAFQYLKYALKGRFDGKCPTILPNGLEGWKDGKKGSIPER